MRAVSFYPLAFAVATAAGLALPACGEASTPAAPTARTIPRQAVLPTLTSPLPTSPNAKPLAPVVPSQLFARSSPWTTPVPRNARTVRNSAAMVRLLVEQVAEHRQWINTTAYSAPVYKVGPAQPLVRVIQDTNNPVLRLAFAAVPLPPDIRPAAGTDRSAVVWQPSTDSLWEFWQLRKEADGWRARWGGRIFAVSRSSGVFPAPFGTSASGMSLVGGLLRPEEVRKGRVDHALAIGVPAIAPAFVPPANRTDGRTPGGIPLGTRLRLDPDLDLDTLPLTRVGRVLARAAQRYGIFVRDSSGSVPFYAQDPVNMDKDPWPEIFEHKSPTQVLAGFPWHRMQVVAP